jgi:hypothetical protein
VVTANGYNDLEFVADGGSGTFRVNGQDISHPDLSGNMDSGSIAVITGSSDPHYELDRQLTIVENLRVFTLGR